MWEKIRNAGIRALRTFAQTALGVYLAGLVASPALGDLGSWTLIEAAAAAGIVAVLWNVAEELKGVEYNKG